jgi:hypothetical protein
MERCFTCECVGIPWCSPPGYQVSNVNISTAPTTHPTNIAALENRWFGLKYTFSKRERCGNPRSWVLGEKCIPDPFLYSHLLLRFLKVNGGGPQAPHAPSAPPGELAVHDHRSALQHVDDECVCVCDNSAWASQSNFMPSRDRVRESRWQSVQTGRPGEDGQRYFGRLSGRK